VVGAKLFYRVGIWRMRGDFWLIVGGWWYKKLVAVNFDHQPLFTTNLFPLTFVAQFAKMVRLSVNINKIATLRNSRGGNNPDVVKAAMDCERFGAEGITIHPRPDERHIRYSDARAIRPQIKTEFNIEGNPREQRFLDLVMELRPHQVTLVPDALNQLTSDHGWDTIANKDYLKGVIAEFKKRGIRTSIFVDPVVAMVKGAVNTGTDRIELYTESYAKHFHEGKEAAIAPYIDASRAAEQVGLGVNAGHDLDLHNLAFFAKCIPNLLEVSIGHALISDSLYFGLENTINMYKRQLL
jgi:pyridoxine 5-phosphate synthase